MDFKCLSLDKAKVDALRECIDLCANGYFIKTKFISEDILFIKLRHWKNRRTLCIRSSDNMFVITEDGNQIKRIDYSLPDRKYIVGIHSEIQEKITAISVDGLLISIKS